MSNRNYKGISNKVVLASIFKNLPIELWNEIAQYKTKGPREYLVRVHGREGKKSGNFHQDVKLCDAKSVDVYVSRTNDNWATKLWKENLDLKGKVADLEKLVSEYDINFNELFGQHEYLKSIFNQMDRRKEERRKQNSVL